MRHQKYREWLLVREDLEEWQRQELDAHLAGCAECGEERRRLAALGELLRKTRPADPPADLLQESRMELRSVLRSLPESALRRMLRRFGVRVKPPLRLALGAGALFAAGLAAGVFWAGRTAATESPGPAGETRIENVRVVASDPARNEVTCAFDMVRSSTLTGNVSDEAVQRVLLHALLHEQNPGTRLRSAATLGASPDPEVKRALIKAVAGDENPGVRQAALKALQKLPFDGDIKAALIGVLGTEQNAAMRIAAINALDSAKVSAGFADDALMEALRRSMNRDENTYVRVRSQSVLEEIKEQ